MCRLSWCVYVGDPSVELGTPCSWGGLTCPLGDVASGHYSPGTRPPPPLFLKAHGSIFFGFRNIHPIPAPKPDNEGQQDQGGHGGHRSLSRLSLQWISSLSLPPGLVYLLPTDMT